MTTEQPRAERRLLRRSTDDRVIGGVAGGLGDYLNVDPLLIRVSFVGLMVFGGLGLILYLAGWLLIPEDNEAESIGGQMLDRTGLTAQRFLIGSLIAVAAFIVIWTILPNYGNDNLATALVVAIVVIVAGTALLRQNEPKAGASDPATEIGLPAAAVDRAPRRERVARVKRPRSPLAGYVTGAALAALGLLALVANVSNLEVAVGQYFGLALAAIGIGLIVGTWWGHGRVLILLGLVLLPFAWAASLIHVPFEGGFGAHNFSPRSAEELAPEYRLAGGEIVLDLTQLERTSKPVEITATVAMGTLIVRVPEDADLQVEATVGGGDLTVLDRWQTGTNITERQVVDGDGQRFVLDLEAGVGAIRVESATQEVIDELQEEEGF